MPTWCQWFVLASNTLAFLAYARDKLAARWRWRRVAERTLLLFTFLGCIGAWCAMGLLRHKTSKPSFRRRALVLTVLNPLWFALWWFW
jgi:uncharacterized membrane protein YsdA (DUF1294 family)